MRVAQGNAFLGQCYCVASSFLKPMLVRLPPRNLEEWGSLPLWNPHLAHLTPGVVRCKTQAQHRLREEGVLTQSDISSPRGELLSWPEVATNVEDSVGKREFTTLVSNLHAVPHFPDSQILQPVFFEASHVILDIVAAVWQFLVPESAASSSWQNIVQNFAPTHEFTVCAGHLVPKHGVPSAPPISAHRILTRSPTSKANSRTHWGRWTPDRAFLQQHGWQDRTALLDTSAS